MSSECVGTHGCNPDRLPGSIPARGPRPARAPLHPRHGRAHVSGAPLERRFSTPGGLPAAGCRASRKAWPLRLDAQLPASPRTQAADLRCEVSARHWAAILASEATPWPAVRQVALPSPAIAGLDGPMVASGRLSLLLDRRLDGGVLVEAIARTVELQARQKNRGAPARAGTPPLIP